MSYKARRNSGTVVFSRVPPTWHLYRYHQMTQWVPEGLLREYP